MNKIANHPSDDTLKINKSYSEEDPLSNICSNGHTFLWDLLVTYSSIDENHFTRKFTDELETTEVRPPSSRTSLSQQEKILKEAEKQLQTLLCLPSTDKRIRIKFIENCLQNLKSNKACVLSMRLLTKLFSSFQQYSTSSGGSNLHHVNSSSYSSSITSPKGNKEKNIYIKLYFCSYCILQKSS